jgi:predicted ATPase
VRPSCECAGGHAAPRLVALTGGPGAGKTAVLETVRQHFCEHVVVLPESAGILFAGGFPRLREPLVQRHAQRAIYYVQRELEALTVERGAAAIVLCDRGTLDGVAYWPGSADSYFADLGTTLTAELARYAAVIHLTVPPAAAYNHDNPLRLEAAGEAHAIDERIATVWSQHAAYHAVPSQVRFLDKVEQALTLIKAQLPACCAQSAERRATGARRAR